MCGLIYSYDLTGANVVPELAKQFAIQKNRGLKGFGFYLPRENKLVHNVKAGRTLKLLEKNETSEALFHHRQPTSTVNRRSSCHPFSTKDFFKTNYVLAHNGVIRNAHDRKAAHEKLGIKYVSEYKEQWSGVHYTTKFNDSETLLWDLALYLEGKIKKVEAVGAMAFILLEMKKGKPIRVHFGRNSERPLKFYLGKTHLLLASEGPLDDIDPHVLYSYSHASNTITTTDSFFRSTSYVQVPYVPPADNTPPESHIYQPPSSSDNIATRYINARAEKEVTHQNFPVLKGWAGYGLGGIYNDRERTYWRKGGDADPIPREDYIMALSRHISGHVQHIYPDPLDGLEYVNQLNHDIDAIWKNLMNIESKNFRQMNDLADAEDLAEAATQAEADLEEIARAASS